MKAELERTPSEAQYNYLNALEEQGVQVFMGAGNGMRNEITSDAWGRQKSVTDYSIFHGLFTFDIPLSVWLKLENGVEVTTSTRIASADGAWVIKSGATIGDVGFLRSKRHPRYQPNRGHLFSTALFLPVPTAIGKRKIWMINSISGAYFQIEDGKLYAVIFNAWVEKLKTELDLSTVGLTIADLAFGHLYDIQFQWRGVGDYFFYIDQKLIYKTAFLGANTELTIFNPAMSVGFESTNTDGTEVQIKIGCVDVTSEGWIREWVEPVSIVNATAKAVNTANYPAIIARVKTTMGAVPNTRDVRVFQYSGSSDQRTYIKAYSTRDATAITGASFVTAGTGSGIEYNVSATAIDTAKCKLLWTRRIEANASLEVGIPSELINVYLTPGDYMILTCERDAPAQVANVICGIEMGEEI